MTQRGQLLSEKTEKIWLECKQVFGVVTEGGWCGSGGLGGGRGYTKAWRRREDAVYDNLEKR